MTTSTTHMKTYRTALGLCALFCAMHAPGAQAPAQSESATNLATASAEVPQPAATSDTSTNLLRLNFRAASLDQVLSYFSEAAGYTINIKPGTSVRGRVDVW